MSGLNGVKPGQNLQGTALEGTSTSESDAETLALFDSLFAALQPDHTMKPDGDTSGQVPATADFMAKSALTDPSDMTALSLERQAGDTRLSNEEVMAFLSEAPAEDVDGLARLLVVAGKIIESAEATDGAMKPEIVVMNDGPDTTNPHPASDMTTATVVQALRMIRQAETGSSLQGYGIDLSELSALVVAGRGSNSGHSQPASQQQQLVQVGKMMSPSPQFIGPMPTIQWLTDNSDFIGPMPRAVMAQPSPAFVGPMPMLQHMQFGTVAGTNAGTLEGLTADPQHMTDELAVEGRRDGLPSQNSRSKSLAGQPSVKVESEMAAKQAQELAGVADRVLGTPNNSKVASSSGASGTIVNLSQLFGGSQDNGTGYGQGQHNGHQLGPQPGSTSGSTPGSTSASQAQAPTDLLQATGREIAGRDLAGRVMAHRLNMDQSGWPENMVRQLDSNLRSGIQTIRIVLEPRQLGRLNVELGLRNGRATIRVGAETAEAARRLASARGQLGAMLENAGLRLASFQTSSADLASGADNAGSNTSPHGEAGRDGETSSNKQAFSNTMNDVDPDDLPDDAKPRADETAVLSILA